MNLWGEATPFLPAGVADETPQTRVVYAALRETEVWASRAELETALGASESGISLSLRSLRESDRVVRQRPPDDRRRQMYAADAPDACEVVAPADADSARVDGSVAGVFPEQVVDTPPGTQLVFLAVRDSLRGTGHATRIPEQTHLSPGTVMRALQTLTDSEALMALRDTADRGGNLYAPSPSVTSTVTVAGGVDGGDDGGGGGESA